MDLLRQAFRDIAVGSTAARVLERRCWIKHLSYADQIGFDATRDEFYEEARKEGLLTEEEKMVQLRAMGVWTDQKEVELAQAKELVVGLIDGKRKNAVRFPSMVKSYVKQIEEAEKAYETKLAARRALLDLTCENYADRQANDTYIVANLYSDPAMAAPLFSDTEFQHFSDQTVFQIVRDYHAALEGCSDHNLKKLAMQPFFQRYFGLCGEDVTPFFGKPICSLTSFQVDLLRYGAHFRHIYSSQDTSVWPKDVKEDPDLFLDYADSVVKAKEKMQEQGAYDGQTAVVGLNKEDRKATGVPVNMNPMREMAKLGR